jgi:hypothetical protein
MLQGGVAGKSSGVAEKNFAQNPAETKTKVYLSQT